MRLFGLASLSLVALVAAAQTGSTGIDPASGILQSFQELPECVVACLLKAIPQAKCALSDTACLCADQEYAATSEQCLLANCSVKDSLRAARWQYEFCPVKEHNAGPHAVHGAITLLILTSLMIAARFYARWRIQTSSIGLDDWSLLLAFIIFIPSTALVIQMSQNGMGSDIWTVSFDNITRMFKNFYIVQFFYQVVVSLTKVSIVLLYMRLFPKDVFPRFHIICWTTIGALIAYMLAFIIVFLAECQPISYFWNQWDGEHVGHCVDIGLAAYINGGLNLFFDLVVFILPIPRLLKLQVSDKSRKIGVILTFSLGLFVTICSVIRLTYLAAVGKYSNATYHWYFVAFWTGMEGYLGIICACMPAILGPLRAFLRDTVSPLITSYARSSGLGSKNSGLRSRETQDSKGATRLPSRSSERGDEVELATNAQKGGVTEKTSVHSLYDLRGEQRSRGSDEGAESAYSGSRSEGKDPYIIE